MKLSRRTIFALPVVLRPALGATVPRPAGEFEYQMPGGKTELISQYKGKILLVEFLLTTCPGCQKSARVLSGVQRDYAAKGVQVLGVAYNPEAPMAAAGFQSTYAQTFPVGYKDRVRVEDYLQLSPVMRNYVPNLVVIDRNWVIRAQHAGDDAFFHDTDKNVRTLLDSLLKESPAKPGKKKK